MHAYSTAAELIDSTFSEVRRHKWMQPVMQHAKQVWPATTSLLGGGGERTSTPPLLQSYSYLSSTLHTRQARISRQLGDWAPRTDLGVAAEAKSTVYSRFPALSLVWCKEWKRVARYSAISRMYDASSSRIVSSRHTKNKELGKYYRSSRGLA